MTILGVNKGERRGAVLSTSIFIDGMEEETSLLGHNASLKQPPTQPSKLEWLVTSILFVVGVISGVLAGSCVSAAGNLVQAAQTYDAGVPVIVMSLLQIAAAATIILGAPCLIQLRALFTFVGMLLYGIPTVVMLLLVIINKAIAAGFLVAQAASNKKLVKLVDTVTVNQDTLLGLLLCGIAVWLVGKWLQSRV